MAAELKRNFNLDAKLTPGSGGIFDVSVDGNKLYSKKKTGRFPEPEEVSRLIRSM